MIFKKCNHNWEKYNHYIYFDIFANDVLCSKIHVFCYKCEKCGKRKKVKMW